MLKISAIESELGMEKGEIKCFEEKPNDAKIDLGQNIVSFDHSETEFLVGRSKECHVVLDDKQISREHLKIIHKSGKWFAQKITPENACLYNGEDFDRAELDSGDTLTVGQFTIHVDSIGEDIHAPASSPSVILQPQTVAATSMEDDLFSSPEPSGQVFKSEPKVEVVSPKKVEPTSIDQDATREINTNEQDFTSEVDLGESLDLGTVDNQSSSASSSSSDATKEFDLSDGLESLDGPMPSEKNQAVMIFFWRREQ